MPAEESTFSMLLASFEQLEDGGILFYRQHLSRFGSPASASFLRVSLALKQLVSTLMRSELRSFDSIGLAYQRISI